jgi:hypothetical protein
MKGHRAEPRTALMALVEVSWQEPSGITNVAPARMEDTSPSGACIRLPRSIRTGSEVTVKRRSEEFSGITRYCRRDGADYVLGLKRISKEAAAQARAPSPRRSTHAAAAPAQYQGPASAQAHAAINGATANPIANVISSASANATANAGAMQQPPVPVSVPVSVPAPVPVTVPANVPAMAPRYVAVAPQVNLPVVAEWPAESHDESQAAAAALMQSRVPDTTVAPPELRSYLPPEVPPELLTQVQPEVLPELLTKVPLQSQAPAAAPAQLRTQPPVFAEGRPHGDALAQPHPSALTHSVLTHTPVPIRADLQLTQPPLAEPPQAQPPAAQPPPAQSVPNLPRANYEVLPQPIPQPQVQQKPPAEAPMEAPIDAPAEVFTTVLSEVCVPVPPPSPSPARIIPALASQDSAASVALPLLTPMPAPTAALPEDATAQIPPLFSAGLPVASPAPMQNANKVAEVPPISPPPTSFTLPAAPVSIAATAHAAPPPVRQEAAPTKIAVPAGITQARAIPVPEMKHAPQISQNQQLSPREVTEMHMQEPTPDKERKAMSSKWMNLTMGRQKQEASNGQTNSQTNSKSSSAPVAIKPKSAAPADIEVADEIHTDADTMGRGRARPQGDLQSMDDIYRGAGIMTPRMGYSATKIVEMLESSHMRGLSSEAKRAAVLMALDAASISVSEVERDARRRQDALDAYEADQRNCFEEYWTRKADANAQIQAEIDWLTARSMERIKRNLDDIAAEKAEFARWHTMKQQEAARISEAVALCSKPSAAIAAPALSSGASVASSAAASVASSAAASAEPAGGLMLALAEVEPAAKPA